MDCNKVTEEVLFLFFDNELGDDLRKLFHDHLARCPGCAHRFDHTRRLLIIVRQRCVRRAAPPSLRTRILTSLPHRQGYP